MNNLKAKLEKALAFDEFAGMKNDYVEGRQFENSRLAPLHAALLEAVEALEYLKDDSQYGEYVKKALAKIDEALKKEK